MNNVEGAAMETKGRMSEGNKKPQSMQTPLTEWDQDLHPNSMSGQNIGSASGFEEKGLRTAYDVKPVHRMLSGITDDDLKQIPILAEGMPLQQGATYLDLQSDQPEEFTATGEMTAEQGHFYIPKSEVPYPVWNLITGRDTSSGSSST